MFCQYVTFNRDSLEAVPHFSFLHVWSAWTDPTASYGARKKQWRRCLRCNHATNRSVPQDSGAPYKTDLDETSF